MCFRYSLDPHVHLSYTNDTIRDKVQTFINENICHLFYERLRQHKAFSHLRPVISSEDCTPPGNVTFVTLQNVSGMSFVDDLFMDSSSSKSPSPFPSDHSSCSLHLSMLITPSPTLSCSTSYSSSPTPSCCSPVYSEPIYLLRCDEEMFSSDDESFNNNRN